MTLHAPASWPFAARSEELDLLTSVVTDGLEQPDRPAGAVIVSPPGVGKTRLARECLGWAADRGLPTAWVVGTRSTASTPYAAVSHLAPGVDATRYGDIGALYAAFARALHGTDDSRPVLVVDDAHLLDEGSAALVLHLTLAASATVIVTVRRGERVSDSVTALWKDGLALRVDLQEFSLEETESLIDDVLDHRVGAQARRRLASSSGGNALFVRELVLGAMESGSLRRTDGYWRWDGKVPPAPRLADLVDQRLRDLDQAAQEAVAVVALGDPLDLTVAESLAGAAAVGRGELAGLIQINGSADHPVCRLAHPLYGDVLLAGRGVVEQRRLHLALADAFEQRGRLSDDELMRMATWRLNGGGALDAETLVYVAVIANRSFDYGLGERFARTAVDVGAGLDAVLALATALNGQGRYEDCERLLAPVAGDAVTAPDDAHRREYLEQRFNALHVGLGRREEAERVLDQFARARGDAHSVQLVAGYRARTWVDAGRMRDVLALTSPILGDPGAAGDSVLAAAQFQAEALAYLGRTTTARELHARMRALPPTVEHPRASRAELFADMQAILCQFLEGRAQDAVRVVGRYYETLLGTNHAGTRGLAALSLGAALLLRGRPRRAERVLTEGAVEVTWPDVGSARSWVAALQAQAHALLGDVESARTALDRSREVRPDCPSARCRSDLVLAEVYVLMAEHAPGASAQAALDGAEQLRELKVYRAAALHLAARMGAEPERVHEQVADLADQVESRYVRLLADHLSALCHDDGAELESVAERFEQLGTDLLAAECAAQASASYHRAGRSSEATRSAARGRALARRCEGAWTPALDLASPLQDLSPREREVARLAGDGLTNLQIAERLVVSVRTVESHLYQAFGKLGVEHRDELARVLEAPGSVTGEVQ